MKTISKLIAMAVILTLSVQANGQEQKKSVKDAKTETVQFTTSMTCNMCVGKIMDNLPKEKGVKDVKTDLENKTVTVTFQKDKNSTQQIKRSIEKLGFTAKLVTTGTEKR
ncbi:MAG: heavy metal-associated domain-containing protein [Bacteroidales bacterium]|jgi:copper chaperone CopZ|nr:heavy metal-associated domain-containing protein [Bacteroidales bacterium]